MDNAKLRIREITTNIFMNNMQRITKTAISGILLEELVGSQRDKKFTTF